jgi:hypothetical protein
MNRKDPQVLPPLDNDMRDIILIPKVNRCFLPVERLEADARFWSQLVSELPAPFCLTCKCG